MRRIVLWGLGGLLAVLAVAGGALVWRLMHGPISLDALTPRINRALAEAGGPVTASVGSTSLVWNGWSRGIDLTLHDVEVHGADGSRIAMLPAAAVRLSARALLAGRVAFAQVTITGARVRLVRSPDGTLGITVGEGGSESGGTELLREALDALAGTAPPSAPLANLHRVAVEHCVVTIDDEAVGLHVTGDIESLTLHRDASGARATLAGRLGSGDVLVPVEGDARWTITWGLAGKLEILEPLATQGMAKLLGPGPARDALERLDLPISGSVAVALDRAFYLERGWIEVHAGKGSIAVPELPAGRLAVHQLRLVASVDAVRDRAEVRRARVDLGSPVLRLKARVGSLRTAPRLHLATTSSNLPVPRIKELWPTGVVPDARGWVTTNITAGAVPRARVRVDGTMTDGGFALADLRGRLGYRGLAVRYVDTMTPATAVAGNAILSPGTWTFRVDRGTVGSLTVTNTTAALSNLDVPDPTRLAVDAQVAGPVADAIRILDQPPLGYAKALGVTPAGAAGTTATRLWLDLPVSGTVRPSDVTVTSTTTLSNLVLPKLTGRWSVAATSLSVDQGNGAVRIRGDAQVSGVPLTVDWLEWTPGGRDVVLSGRTDDAGRRALGADLAPWVTGPADVHAVLAQDARGVGRLDVSAELTTASVELPVLGMPKPPGTYGRLGAQLVLSGDAITGVPWAELKTGGSMLWGKATLVPGRTAVRTLDLDARLAPPGRGVADLTLRVQPAGATSAVTLSSTDAGTMLAVIDSYADAAGGRLTCTGTADMAGAGLPFDTRCTVERFRITRSPTLARLATLTSFSGMMSALNGSGIEVDQLAVGLVHRTPLITVNDGALSGPSLRILFGGTIDRERSSLDMRGTFIPSIYGLNELAGSIPVLGTLVGGGGQERAIQAVDFTVTGALGDPKVSVNPLSAVAPGILRDLLRRLPGTGRGR